jgi:hypothetical protein
MARSSSTPSSPSSQTSERTNSLMVTQISPAVVDRVLLHFSTYGEIHQWVSLEKSFARIMIVYKHEEDAELAKLRCGDRLVLEATRETYG